MVTPFNYHVSSKFLPHLEIPPPSKCHHIFQPSHPKKCHPQNLTAWYRGATMICIICAHACIQIGLLLKLCTCMRVDLCRHRPQNLAALELLPRVQRLEIKSHHCEISRKYSNQIGGNQKFDCLNHVFMFSWYKTARGCHGQLCPNNVKNSELPGNATQTRNMHFEAVEWVNYYPYAWMYCSQQDTVSILLCVLYPWQSLDIYERSRSSIIFIPRRSIIAPAPHYTQQLLYKALEVTQSQ